MIVFTLRWKWQKERRRGTSFWTCCGATELWSGVITKSNCLLSTAGSTESATAGRGMRKGREEKEGRWKAGQGRKVGWKGRKWRRGEEEDGGERVGGGLPALQTAWCVALGKWSEVLAPPTRTPHHHEPQFQPHSASAPATLYWVSQESQTLQLALLNGERQGDRKKEKEREVTQLEDISWSRACSLSFFRSYPILW